MATLLERNQNGLYCARGEFYIDPWGGVDHALVTHAHSDHLYAGSKRYLTARAGEPLVRARLGADARIESVEYGASIEINGVRISFHPAGHILGSAQIRLEHRGEIWVVSGDYKVAPDPTCAAFEPVKCHTFITESTFGLPIYRWLPPSTVFDEINAWWRTNQQAERASVLFGYPVGKAQRLLAGIDSSIGPIYAHGAVERVNRIYRASGIPLPAAAFVRDAPARTDWSPALILAPLMSKNSPWMRRFGRMSTGFASGWMRIRGTRRRRSIDRGFVLSDHADWPGLMAAIEATSAERVWVTHGYQAQMVRWLAEKGLDAQVIETQYEGDRDEAGGEAEAEAAAGTESEPAGTGEA